MIEMHWKDWSWKLKSAKRKQKPPGKDRWRSPLPLVLVYHDPLQIVAFWELRPLLSLRRIFSATPKVWSSTRSRTENVRSVKKWTETRKNLPKTIPKTCWFLFGSSMSSCFVEGTGTFVAFGKIYQVSRQGYVLEFYPKTFPKPVALKTKMVQIPMFSRQF